MTAALLSSLELTVMVLVFAIGLDSTRADLVYLWRRPWLLAKSLLAMYVLVPILAFILVKVLPLSTGVAVALLVLAISAGAPLLPRKLMGLGDGAYIFSLVVTSSLLAIVTVPAWLKVLAAHFGASSSLAPRDLVPVIGRAFIAPLALGMLVRRFVPEASERLSDWLLKVAGGVLALCALLLLALHRGLLLEAGWLSLAALAAMALGSLAIGHLLGGPEPDDRAALALSCATRHVGMAVVVAAAVPGPRAAALIAVYLVVSALVSAPYLRWRRRADRPRGG